MTNSHTLDRVFHALADPTRRAVVERLTGGPRSVSELAAPFAMALPSFVGHLRVLEQCGLIASVKHGRVRTCRIAGTGMQRATAWLDEQRQEWQRRLDRHDDYVRHLHDKEQEHD